MHKINLNYLNNQNKTPFRALSLKHVWTNKNQEENSKHEEPLQEVIQFTVLAFKALALIRIW